MFIPSEGSGEFFFMINSVAAKIVNFWRSIKKMKHSVKKHLHCTYKALKNITQCFDRKTFMELSNKISKPSVVKIISEKQLFFKVKFGLKNNNSHLKIARKFFPVSQSQPFLSRDLAETIIFFSWLDYKQCHMIWHHLAYSKKLIPKLFLRVKA